MVRFWTERGLFEPTAPVQDLGARLGAWLDVRQAIQLHQLLGTGTDTPARGRPRASEPGRWVEETLTSLREAILMDRFAPGLWRNPMPVDGVWQPMVWVDFWEPYRRYMADHQKQIALILGRLRRRLREALSDAGGTCHALAQIDAVFDQTLTPRETRLLASLPFKYEHRLATLVKGLDLQAQDSLPPGSVSNPLTRRPPKPEWLLSFEHDMRQSLLAELELRSQPVLGLLDALKAHSP
jgi:hypothetical protein